MANKDTILTIYDSDIISESMHKINYNFELLLNKDDVSDWKLSKLEQKINNELDNIKRTSDERASGLSRDLDDLEELLKGLSTHEEIQAMVNAAITNAESTLRGFISTMAGEQISEMVAGFAKTADLRNLQNQIDTLNGKIEGLDGGGNQGGDEYVSSEAFTQYKSDAERKMASANMMAANSTFKKDANGYYILFNNDPSQPEQSSGFKSLVDYYTYLRNTDNFDPTGLGLSDPDICKEFLRRCESYFQSVFTELAQFRASVSEGEAVAEVLASVRDDENNTLVAAIFARARKEGTEVVLNADNINLDGKKIKLYGTEDVIIGSTNRLALVTGGFTINSENLVVDLAGNVEMTGDLTAKTLGTLTGNTKIDSEGNLTTINANISGNLTATTLTAANGNTKIDSNGVLYATGAKIRGDIKAEQFLATDIVDVNASNGGYTGTITKTTILNGNSFNISAEGTLTDSQNSTRSVTGNQLYIKIVDEVENPDNPEIPDNWMYGVPMLCMRYVDSTGTPHEYVLKPNIWKDINGTPQGDTSDMRWLRQYNTSVLKYEPNSYRLNSSTDTYHHYKNTITGDLAGTLYMFNTDNTATFMTGSNDTDNVYRLFVYDLGIDDTAKSENLSDLKRTGLVENIDSVTISDKVYLNEHTAYALKSKIENRGGSSYLGPSDSQTRIPDVIDDYPGYLQNTMDFGVNLHFTHEFYSLTTSYGIQNLYDFMVYALGGVKDSYGGVSNNNWKMTGGVSTTSDFIYAEILTAYQGFIGNLPFSIGGYYTSNGNYIYNPTIEFTINAYPKISITGNGKNVGGYTNCIYGNCVVEIKCDHYVENSNTKREDTQEIYNAPIQFGYQTFNYDTMQYDHDSGEFIPHSMYAKLEFGFIFSLNGSGISFDPLNPKERSVNDDEENNIMCKIYNFLKTFNFINNIKNKKGAVGNSNIYPDHAKFTATIGGVTKTPRQYGGFEIHDATLTKTTIL